MKKKWAALLFAALFSLSATVLAACSEPENSGDEGKDPGGEEPPVAELVYPDDPEFESLSSSENGVSGSHDPSLIEVDGTFYSFSTGWLNGGNEIRRSTDLIHWDYVGVTFNNFQGNAPSGESWDTEYSDVLEALHAPSMDTISFWAPDIVEAATAGIGSIPAAYMAETSRLPPTDGTGHAFSSATATTLRPALSPMWA